MQSSIRMQSSVRIQITDHSGAPLLTDNNDN